MQFFKKLVITILALVGFCYLVMMASIWYQTDGFSNMSSSFSSKRGRCTHALLASAVSPDFSKVAKHERERCEAGVEQHVLSIRPADQFNEGGSLGVVIASNAEGFNSLPDPALPVRLYWKSQDELWVQHQWSMNFHVDTLDGVAVEVSKFLPD